MINLGEAERAAQWGRKQSKAERGRFRGGERDGH